MLHGMPFKTRISPSQVFLLLTRIKNIGGNTMHRAHSTGGGRNPSRSLTSDDPYLRYHVFVNTDEDVISALCSSGIPNHHIVIRTLRIAGWELNAKIVYGIANEDLKMT